jgi:Leucine rich repeat
MTSLRELFLSHNFLQEEIPSEFGLLTHLKDLDLQHNAIKGKVPTELGNLKSLGEIRLPETGSFPSLSNRLSTAFTLHNNREIEPGRDYCYRNHARRNMRERASCFGSRLQG